MWQDRIEAGQKLAQKLKEVLGEEKTPSQGLVLAIPRGGVVVGQQIAKTLNYPLDVIIVKKIGAPGNPELAVGAVGFIGESVIDEDLVARLGVEKDYLEKKITEIKNQIIIQGKEWRAGKEQLDLKNKIVVITDDGVATGATVKSAMEIARQANPQKIILAVPVIAKESLNEIENLADEMVYLEAPELFFAVGQFYQNFDQITDEEVKELLK